MARTAIGLDIGHRHVRACALRRVGRDRLELEGVAEVSRYDEDGDQKSLAVSLAELDARLRLRLRGPVTVAVNDAQTLVRFVNTLPLPPDRLARLLRLELSQHTDEQGDLAADSWVVPIPGEEMTHGCVLAQPGPLSETLAALAKLGVRTSQVHYAPAAAYHATLTQPPLEAEELALLIDIGAELTGVTLIGDNRLLACRQVGVGAAGFAAAIAQDQASAQVADAITAATRQRDRATPAAMPGPGTSGISWLDELDTPGAPPAAVTAAPAPALDLGGDGGPWLDLDDDGDADADAAPAAPADDAPSDAGEGQLYVLTDDDDADAPGTPEAEEIPDPGTTRTGSRVAAPGAHTMQMAMAQLGPELTRAAEALYAQIYSTLHWFRAQLKLSSLEPTRIWLAGAGCGVVGLDVYFGRRFNAPVTRLDPFAGIEPAATRGRAAAAHVPDRPWEWAVAAGLALADPALRTPAAVPLDLRPETSLRRELWRSTLAWPYVAAAGVLLAAGVVLWTGWQRAAAYDAQLAAVQGQQKRIADFQREGEQVDQQNADLREDLRAIAARIYAGRDLLYAVRALKEEAVGSHELWVTTFETQGVASDAEAAPAPGSGRPGVAKAGTKPAPGRLAGAAGAAKWSDTTIDRGAIDISGKVRFDSAPAASQIDDQLRMFFDRWYKTISTWTPGAGQPPLFRDARVLEYIVKPGKAKLDGDFPWKVRLYFQQTQLDQMLLAAEPARPEAPARPAAPARPGTPSL